jgi:osmoprotectant transport system permease protein
VDALLTTGAGGLMSDWDHFRHFMASVVGWFTTSANWTGSSGIPYLFLRQAELSLAVVLGALVVGGGIGLVLGHTGRGGLVAVNAANAARAVPTLALLILAIPPILTNTYVGMREVDADVRDAAKAMGLTGGQVLRRVELPLATPFLMAGIRTSSIEVVATSTLAAYVSYTDLGTPVISGLSTENTVEAFSGAILVAVLAGAVALGLGVLGRAITPLPIRHTRSGTALTTA